MAALLSSQPQCVIARWKECSADRSATAGRGGSRVIWYRGEAHLLMGMYFARGLHGKPELRVILRELARFGEAIVHGKEERGRYGRA